MIRRFAALAAVASALSCTAAAAAAVPIGPDQTFVGLVNGAQSNATVKMACLGPVSPGQLGHPFPDQPLEVNPASTSASLSGFTANASNVEAIFTALGAPEYLAGFNSYHVKVAIPTSASLPCSGQSSISFTPFPTSQAGLGARPFSVTVNFVSQP